MFFIELPSRRSHLETPPVSAEPAPTTTTTTRPRPNSLTGGRGQVKVSYVGWNIVFLPAACGKTEQVNGSLKQNQRDEGKKYTRARL